MTSTPQHRASVKAAATERAARTAVQGLALDVAVAVAVALLAWLPNADLSSSAAWIILGTSLAKTILTAVASYVMRLKVSPAEERVRTAVPSADGRAFTVTDVPPADGTRLD